MLQNIYNKYEKEMIEIINQIKPMNFIGVSKIIGVYLFNKNINLTDSQLMTFTHKIVKNNVIYYKEK